MRPIDADTLKKSIERLCEDERTNMTAITYFALHDLLDTMPTVKAEPDNGWISVKDRLPEKHGWYLTAHKRIYQTDAGMKICFFYHGYFTTDMEITHWMPLPEYPESEDDAE